MAIDWHRIFHVDRPDLNPPGFDLLIEDMRNNPWQKPERKTTRTTKKQGRSFPSAKHGAD